LDLSASASRRQLRLIFPLGKTVSRIWLASLAAGKEVERQMLTLSPSANKTSFTGQASFARHPEEVALFGRCRFQGEPVEIVRKQVRGPRVELLMRW